MMFLHSEISFRLNGVALLMLVSSCLAIAQEGTWSVSGGGGVAYIFLSDVKGDMRRDVEGYNNAGYLIQRFPSPSLAAAWNGKVVYRYDRDYSFSLAVHLAKRTVATDWKDQERSLDLQRTIGSTAVMFGIGFHFPTGMEGDLYAEVELGMMFGHATSSALRLRTYKLSDTSLTYETELLDDTKGTFDKSKLIVAVAFGGSLKIAGPFFIRGEGLYRFAQIGKIDGKVTTFGQTRDQTTSINFNFSGFMATVGIGMEFY